MDIETLIGPWFWAALGVVLLILEVLGVGGFLLGAGVSGLILAVISAVIHLNWQTQCVIYVVISVASTFVYLRFWHPNAVVSEDPLLNNRMARLVGTKTRLITPISGGEGRVQISDALWSVKCEKDLLEGVMVEIVSYEGAVLVVKEC